MSNKKIELFCLSTERHCLATLIQYNDLYCEIDLIVKESDFANSFHRALYRIITRLIKENVSTTDIILAAQLNQMGLSKFENDLNSGEYVASICKIPINRASGMDFFKQLLNFRIRRDYENTIQEIREIIHSTTLSTADLIQAIDTIYANKTKDIINLNSADSPDIMSSLEDYIEDLGDNPLDESKILYGPFKSVNNLYGSLHRPGNITLIGARSGVAKAQPIDSKVLTPNGWAKIGDIKVGEYVIGSDGKPKMVLGVFPQGKKSIFEVILSDGGKTRCCDDHLWTTHTYKNRKNKLPINKIPLVKTTKELRSTLYDGDHLNHALEFVKPCEMTKKDLPLDPYLLGLLLGDGSFRGGNVKMTSSDSFIIKKINLLLATSDKLRKVKASRLPCYDYIVSRKERLGGECSSLKKCIVDLGLNDLLSDKKFIPHIYMQSSIEDRLKLLQGLMDTDGTVCSHNGGVTASFSSTSKIMAEQVRELVLGLGGRATMSDLPQKPWYYDDKRERVSGKDSWRLFISFSNDINPFLLPRKRKSFKKQSHYQYRYIKEINPAGVAECVCIKVDADDSLYVTDDYILTHNTSLSLYYNIWMAEKYNMPIVWVDHGEMTVEELQIRAAAIFANGVVPLFAIENGDWRKNPSWVAAIREGLKRAKKIKFFYENVGSKNPNQIISTIRRLKYNKIGRENNFLWVYDYLKPFNSEDGDMPEWKMMGHFIQDIKSFIQTELKTSFFTAIQLNRAGITNNKKAGQVDDSENTITISDRITQQTSHTFLVRRKLNEALAVEGGKFGNLVMIAVKTRHLGKMAERALSPVNVNGDMKSNYINLNMKNFMFEDKGDLVDLLPQLQDKIDVDEDKEKGNIEL